MANTIPNYALGGAILGGLIGAFLTRKETLTGKIIGIGASVAIGGGAGAGYMVVKKPGTTAGSFTNDTGSVPMTLEYAKSSPAAGAAVLAACQPQTGFFFGLFGNNVPANTGLAAQVLDWYSNDINHLGQLVAAYVATIGYSSADDISAFFGIGQANSTDSSGATPDNQPLASWMPGNYVNSLINKLNNKDSNWQLNYVF